MYRASLVTEKHIYFILQPRNPMQHPTPSITSEYLKLKLILGLNILVLNNICGCELMF